MNFTVSRRGAAAGLAATLAACAALPPPSLDEAVRRLLRRSTERALARLNEPGGAWDKFVARLDLASALGPAGMMLQRTMMTPAFHRQLDAWLRPIALRAAHAAAPRIAAAVRVMGIDNARAVLAGGPRAATQLLRSAMGPAVIEAMIPEIRGALNGLGDPGVAALVALGGDALVRKLAHNANEALWDAIGDEEAAIRADPSAGGDPQLAPLLAHP